MKSIRAIRDYFKSKRVNDLTEPPILQTSFRAPEAVLKSLRLFAKANGLTQEAALVVCIIGFVLEYESIFEEELREAREIWTIDGEFVKQIEDIKTIMREG